MAEFVQTMNDWRRMCETIQSKNQKKSTGGWCKGCPIQGYCVIDSAIKDSTNGEISIIGDQIQAWAAEHPESVYPTWTEWLYEMGLILKPSGADQNTSFLMHMGIKLNNVLSPKADTPIPADIAQKLGLEPKEDA